MIIQKIKNKKLQLKRNLKNKINNFLKSIVVLNMKNQY